MGRPDGQSAPAPLPEDLLLMVAHNVRSMAATIHGFAGLPARGIAAGALSAESILSRVHSVSGRLIAMVDDLTHALLLGSGLDHGKGDRVTPSEVVEAAYLDVNGSAEARQQQIDRRIQTSGSVRLVNRPCLQMALRNLLDNAIKYSPIGGGIVLEVFETGDWLTFRVSDSGPGIPPDRLRTLFSRPGSFDFSRVQQGMGLGLWITKRVAEWHGGDVHAESNPGGGATLVLRVRAPFADPGATPAVQPPPA
jgi:signal transduction histidine kinase